MSSTAENRLLPFPSGKEDIIFDFYLVLFGELAAEDWVREARLIAYAASEWDIAVIEVSRTPTECPSVEGDEKDCESIGFGASEELEVG